LDRFLFFIRVHLPTHPPNPPTYLKQNQHTGAIGAWFLQRELSRLLEANSLLLKRIAALDTQLGAKHAKTKALAAFVTFDHQDAFVHALSVYKSASWLCMDPALRFKGHRLRLEPAPEPSLILWENLGFGRLARLRRKAVTVVLAGSLILISIVFYFIARYFQVSSWNGWDEWTLGVKDWAVWFTHSIYVV
jgi:hypothetical protein